MERANLSAKTTVMCFFFYILNENQALSVGHREHFVKLHSQCNLSLKLRGTHIVTKPWSGPGCFPREFKEESLPIPSDAGVAGHDSDFAALHAERLRCLVSSGPTPFHSPTLTLRLGYVLFPK